MPRAWSNWWAPLALLVLVAAAYGQTLGFDLVWVDHYLLSGPALQGRLTWKDLLLAPQSAYLPEDPGAERVYRPLLALSVELDRAIWRMRPAGFHLSNVLAHLAVVLLIWQTAWRLTGNRVAAFAAGALLAIHPSAVEPVANISVRADLFVALGIAAVLLLLRGSLGPGGAWRLGGALMAFSFALGWKETAMTIPPIVTWAAWVHPQWFATLGQAPGWRPLAARVVPFWLTLGLYAVLRRVAIGSVVTAPVILADLPDQLLRGLAGIATYAEMTLIPRPVTGYIRVQPPTGPGDPRILFGLAAVALLLAGLWWLRRAHGPSAVALGWYAGALLPPSNFVPIYSTVEVHLAERSLYPALAGWCLFLAVGAHALHTARRSPLTRSRVLGKAAGVLVIGTFLLVTAVKVAAWRDDVTLWTAAVVSDPGGASAHANLSVALAEAGNLEGAHAVIREATARFPQDAQVADMAGQVAERRGEAGEALRQYERVLALGWRMQGPFRRATLLEAQRKDRDRALRWLLLSADRFPRAVWPQVGLGWYYDRAGQTTAARAHFDRAAALAPNSPEPSWFLAQLLGVEGRHHEAARAAQTALALDPSFVPARRALALAAEQAGMTEEAIGHWRRIAALLPLKQRAEAEAHLRWLEKGQHAQGAAGGEPARPR